MRRLGRFLALSPAEKGVLLHSLIVLAWVRWTVTTRGLAAVEARARRVMAVTGGQESAGAGRRVETAEARDVARLLHAAQRALPGGSTCLHLAGALKLLLAERGIASDLRIGARKDLGKLTAHAWLECAGRVLIGGTDVYERYAVFPVVKGGAGGA
jgi:hypothetical protein